MSDNKVEAALHGPTDVVNERWSGEDEVRTASDKQPAARKGTHALALNVHVDNPEDFQTVWDFFNHNAASLGKRMPYANVESWLLGGPEPGVDEPDPIGNMAGEFHDDKTLEKVRQSLVRELDMTVIGDRIYTSDLAVNLIQAMQNDGILFRERS
jgi:hypothetical protein